MEFSKSGDWVGPEVSNDNKSTRAVGLVGSGALTMAGLEVGRGRGVEGADAAICPFKIK